MVKASVPLSLLLRDATGKASPDGQVVWAYISEEGIIIIPFKLLLPLLPFCLLSHNSSDHCSTRDVQMETLSEHDFVFKHAFT